MNTKERALYVLHAAMLLAGAVAGLLAQGPNAALSGLLELQLSPARLLNDFTIIAGPGAALINAALVAAVGLVIVRLVDVRLSGPTIAAIWTMFGFGLFGKTLLNIIAIFVGVGISARLAGKRYPDYVLMALFGTALGPLVTALAFESGLPASGAILVAVGAGLVVGVLLPPLAISLLRLHQGFNLYNVGLTCGFIGVFAAAVLVASGTEFPVAGAWNTEPSLLLQLLVPVAALIFMIVGFAMGGGKAFKDLIRIMQLPGQLPSDFMTMVSVEGALVNAGIMGILTWGYVVLVGGPLNGPVLGGIFTAIGFATFGKHAGNGLPILAGVVLATLLFGKGLTTPGPLLAALFALTLSPLAGEFGWPVGIIAGIIHLTIVEQTGSWHLGVNLYNNGFAGGLTATLLVAIIEWWRASHDTVSFGERRRGKRS
ncbi:MAG: DUF1576 domain-containing protein [Spirochaetota bacterium]